MPANATAGAIAVVRRVVHAAAFGFSRSDSYAYLSDIPGSGTTLTLPEVAGDGDYYEWLDVDGSCSADAIVTVEGSAGQTVQLEASQTFDTAFASAGFLFDAQARNWNMVQAGSGAAATITGTPPITVESNVVALTPAGNGWASNPGIVTVNTGEQIAVSAVITPQVTGHVRVRVTGMAQSEDSAASLTFAVSISQGADEPTPALFTLPTLTVPLLGANPGTVSFALDVALDKLAAPVNLPLHAAATLNVVVTCSDNTGKITIPIGGLQIDLEEMWQ
jgi:hypothetical protein